MADLVFAVSSEQLPVPQKWMDESPAPGVKTPQSPPPAQPQVHPQFPPPAQPQVQVEPSPFNGMVKSCSHVSFAEKNGDNSGWIIHHGDSNDPHKMLTSTLVDVRHESTSLGQKITKPWDENNRLRAEYLERACVRNGQIDRAQAEAQFNRSMLADSDVQRLHEAHSKSTGAVDFESILKSFGASSTERIVCQLKCKGVVNMPTLQTATRDIVGDCQVILTENDDPNQKFRRIYFFQVAVLQMLA